MARSRRNGLLFPAREQVISTELAGEGGVEGDFGKGNAERWIMGFKGSAIQTAGRENMGPGASRLVLG